MDTLFGQGWTNRLMATGKFKMISAAEATGLIGKNAMFHKVWHGSPHDHDKFDSDHIGNGEGAQAYGWGLYFSGSQQVAEWYRDKLSGNLLSAQSYSKDGKTISGMDVLKEYFKPGRIVNGYGGKDEVISFNEDDKGWGWSVVVKGVGETRQRSHSTDPEVREVNGVMDKEGWVGHTGKLYEVDLAPSQDEYLDWDKPFVMQSDKVKELLQAEMDKKYSPIGVANLPELGGKQPFGTGKALYKHIQSHFMSDEDASNYLHSLGIRGVRYKAEAGRSETTSNYVIFNDADIKIEVKYSKNGDVIAFYNPADDTTYLVHDNITQNTSAKALQGLMLHEIGVHALTLGKSNEVFKDILRRFEALKKTNPKVQAAFDRVPKDTKAEDIVEEALAYYLEEHPKSSLAQRIVEWFRQAVRALGKTLPVLERAKFSQWANKLTEAELIGMATSALKSAPDSLQFDNVGRNREGIKLSQSAMKSVVANIKRGREAITQALLNKSTVHRAMFRQGMGWVDFEWGSEGGKITAKGKRPGAKGIAHIIEARQRKDGLNAKQAESLLLDLVDTIAKGEEVNRYEQQGSIRTTINDGHHEVLLVKNKGSNSWMVTGYKIISPDASSSARDALEATRSESTPSRNGVVAGTQTIAQQDDNSSNNNIKFSRSTPNNTPADNSAMRSFFAPALGKQALGWLAGLFQRNHLIDFVAQDLPELVNYS